MNNSSNNNLVDVFLITFISVALIIAFYMLNKDNFKNIYSKSNINSYEKTDIEKVISDYKKKYNVKNINYINDDLICLLIADDNDQVLDSIIIDKNSGKIIPYDSLFKIKTKDELQNKINELLQKKYAKYIVDTIINGYGKIIYEFKNNELVLYYINYSFEPIYNKEVNLHINYNEIDKYLKFKHKLDETYYIEDGYNYDNNKTTIALSFDDGPNGDYTYELLKLLDENKMTATFFMVGNKMNNQADVVKAVDSSLNEIGSHTYSHINMRRVSLDKVTEELNKTDEIYKGITGKNINLVRPPYGAYTKDIIKDYPYSFILWNVDTNDWRYKDVDYLVNHILTHIEDGNIILMHDSYATSIEAVKKVLPILYSRDIQVVSISTLAKMRNINLENGKAYLYLK